MAQIEMPQPKPAIAALFLSLAVFCGPAFAGADCKEPPLGEVVIGAGRLQLFSAPDSRCPMRGVFIVPGDRLIAYAQSDDGWSSVMYSNPKTGNIVSGWVKSARLKQTGTVGPKQ